MLSRPLQSSSRLSGAAEVVYAEERCDAGRDAIGSHHGGDDNGRPAGWTCDEDEIDDGKEKDEARLCCLACMILDA